MHKSTWKRAEEWLADLFGTRRRPLSGNQYGRDDVDGSDSLHDVLFLECKTASKEWAVRTLHDRCKARAKGRPVVIGLVSKNRPGGMICFFSDDLDAVTVERARAQMERLEGTLKELATPIVLADRHPAESKSL